MDNFDLLLAKKLNGGGSTGSYQPLTIVNNLAKALTIGILDPNQNMKYYIKTISSGGTFEGAIPTSGSVATTYIFYCTRVGNTTLPTATLSPSGSTISNMYSLKTLNGNLQFAMLKAIPSTDTTITFS